MKRVSGGQFHPVLDKEKFMKTSLSRLRAGTLAGIAAFGLFTLAPGQAAAQTCPDIGLTGTAIVQTADALGLGQTFPVVAGGSLNLGGCSEITGNGFVAEAPDFELDLSGSTGQSLQVSVAAACDTTLLVNDADGTWSFSDDEDGTSNPRVLLSAAPDGIYDIWIGTFDSPTCDATLTIQTVMAGTDPVAPPPAALCPDYNLESAVLTYDMAQLATPQMLDVVAGGNLDLSGCPEIAGTGFVIEAPDYQLDLTGMTGADLEFRLTAACDTVLLVNDVNADWQYVDDSNGVMDPILILPAAIDGSYDIWVGTYGPDSCSGVLQIGTVGAVVAPTTPGKGEPTAPATPPETPPEVPAAQAMADPGNVVAYRAEMGATLTFTVTGTTDGAVWGTDIYTDDSDLSTAAVHSGAIAAGQTGTVTVQMLGPQPAFQGGPRNAVTTRNFGSWGGSFAFLIQ